MVIYENALHASMKVKHYNTINHCIMAQKCKVPNFEMQFNAFKGTIFILASPELNQSQICTSSIKPVLKINYISGQ